MQDSPEQVRKDIVDAGEVNRRLQAQIDAQRIFELSQDVRGDVPTFSQTQHEASLNGKGVVVLLRGVTQKPETLRYPFDAITTDKDQASIIVQDARTKERLHEISISRPRGEKGGWGATEYRYVQNGAVKPPDFPEVEGVSYTPNRLQSLGSSLGFIKEVLESIKTERKG